MVLFFSTEKCGRRKLKGKPAIIRLGVHRTANSRSPALAPRKKKRNPPERQHGECGTRRAKGGDLGSPDFPRVPSSCPSLTSPGLKSGLERWSPSPFFFPPPPNSASSLSLSLLSSLPHPFLSSFPSFSLPFPPLLEYSGRPPERERETERERGGTVGGIEVKRGRKGEISSLS